MTEEQKEILKEAASIAADYAREKSDERIARQREEIEETLLNLKAHIGPHNKIVEDFNTWISSTVYIYIPSSQLLVVPSSKFSI